MKPREGFRLNIFERAIAAISPRLGLARMQARFASTVLEERLRRYDAATRGRRADGWQSSGTSANAETALDLTTVRNRSRDLVRNNPYSARAIRLLAANVIGTGIRPAPQASSARATARIKQLWSEWADTTDCDHNGQMNFYGIQSLIMRTVGESGEALVVRRRDAEAGPAVRLQVLEPDYIDTTKTLYNANGNSYIIQGVEFDASGKRVAYWLYTQHPGDNAVFNLSASLLGQSRRVPAEDVAHIYLVDRPGQVRGVPLGVSAFLRMRDLDDYEDAQLMRQKIAACFTAFVVDNPGASSDPIGGGRKGDSIDALEPGAIEYLPAGKTIQFAAPPPAEGYGEFMQGNLRAIAAAYGVTYEALTGDLSNVNFSSARMGWLEFARWVTELQENTIIPMLCHRVWGWFVDGLKLKGVIPAARPVPCAWTSPRREMVDPSKEYAALANAVRNGLLSWPEVVRMLGYEPDETLAEIQSFNQKADQAGIILDSDARYPLRVRATANAPKPSDGQQPDDVQPEEGQSP